MRARLLIAALVLFGLFSGTAWGQEVEKDDGAKDVRVSQNVPFDKSYSIEERA